MRKILKGTFILFIGTLIVRSVGMYFRSTLSGAVGSSGMGVYELIFSVYLMVVTLAYSGINTAIIRLAGQGRFQSRALIRTALSLILPLSFTVGCALFVFARPIALGLLHEGAAALPLKILAVSVPFMSASICFSSHFIGSGNTLIPVCCQVGEQLCRVIVLRALLSMRVGGLVSAAIAMSAGEILSCIFVFVMWVFFSKEYGHDTRGIARGILAVSVPLAAGNYLASAIGTAENILLPQKLAAIDPVNAMAMYGMLSGMTMPLLTFPSGLLTSLSTVLMPSVAKDGDGKVAAPYLKFTVTASIFIASVFMCFPYRLGYAVYGSAAVGALVLRLSFMVPTLYSESVISSALNGLGKQKFLVAVNSTEQVLMLLCIIYLVPRFGFDCYITAMFLGSVISCIIKLVGLLHTSGFALDLMQMLFYPSLCALLSGVASRLICANLLWYRLPLAAETAVGIALQGALFCALLLFARGKRRKS